MSSYLIIKNLNSEPEKKIKKLIDKKGSKRLNYSIKNIKDTRRLISLIKYKLDKSTTVVISDIDEATEEALNAFLKTLEEPQKNVDFILTCTNEYLLLDTIKSRCIIIHAQKDSAHGSAVDETSLEFIKGGFSERIKILKNIKKRDEAVAFIKNILYTNQKLIEEEKLELEDSYKLMLGAHKSIKALKANGNVTIQLTHFLRWVV